MLRQVLRQAGGGTQRRLRARRFTGCAIGARGGVPAAARTRVRWGRAAARPLVGGNLAGYGAGAGAGAVAERVSREGAARSAAGAVCCVGVCRRGGGAQRTRAETGVKTCPNTSLKQVLRHVSTPP